MSHFRRTVAVAIFLAGACALSPWAISGEKAQGGKAKAEVLETKATQQELAAATNFSKTLGLSYESLTTLGSRIDQARRVADPVGLASCAQELAVAEQVSGKKAGLTSDAVLKEAAEMAKMRFDPSELKAVSLIAKGNEALSKELATTAAKAEKAEKERIAAAKEGGKTRGIMGQLHADSRVGTSIHVYVDGRYIGTMGPYGDIYRHLGQTAWETTYLSARSNDGRHWNRNVSAAVNNYHWILYP